MLSATRWHRGRDVPVGAEREDEESEGEWVTDNQTTWTRPPSASTDPPCAHRLAAPRPCIRPLWYACFGSRCLPRRPRTSGSRPSTRPTAGWSPLCMVAAWRCGATWPPTDSPRPRGPVVVFGDGPDDDGDSHLRPQRLRGRPGDLRRRTGLLTRDRRWPSRRTGRVGGMRTLRQSPTGQVKDLTSLRLRQVCKPTYMSGRTTWCAERSHGLQSVGFRMEVKVSDRGSRRGGCRGRRGRGRCRGGWR